MFSMRLALIFAALLILASLAACSPLPPATQGPAATQVQQAAPAPTTASAATEAPAASQAPVASPAAAASSAIPDAKADPAAALAYAGNGKLFKTAEFTYTMGMNMTPADDASAKALGAQADALKSLLMQANGQGAIEVTDPAALKSKIRMDMDINAAGQQTQMQMVVIDQTAWVKVAGQDTWQKMEGAQARSVTPGVSPETMLEDFKNAADVQWIEDVTLSGEQMSHLRFTMDPSKLDLATLTGSATASTQLTPEELEGMFKDFKPVVDVWLSKPNLELRGEKMQLEWVMPLPKEANAAEVKLRVAMTMAMQFSKVNEPVKIEAPAE